MSREIKFRAIAKASGDYVYGDLVQQTGLTIFSRYFIAESVEGNMSLTEVALETVGEYTGLNDRNGVEIYEGDIVQMSVFRADGKTAKVRLHLIKWRETISHIGWNIGAGDPRLREVVGNFYENPDLLL